MTWDGDKNQEAAPALHVNDGTPTIRDLAVRTKGGQWSTLASDATPDFTVVSGLRRATDQQLKPLIALGVTITPEVLDQMRWEAFWDSPLNVPGDTVAHGGIHAAGRRRGQSAGAAAQAGGDHAAPRRSIQVKSCDVKTNGARLEISFPGVKLGVFAGRLNTRSTRARNLIRQAIVAKTDERVGRLQVRRRR